MSTRQRKENNKISKLSTYLIINGFIVFNIPNYIAILGTYRISGNFKLKQLCKEHLVPLLSMITRWPSSKICLQRNPSLKILYLENFPIYGMFNRLIIYIEILGMFGSKQQLNCRYNKFNLSDLLYQEVVRKISCDHVVSVVSLLRWLLYITSSRLSFLVISPSGLMLSVSRMTMLGTCSPGSSSDSFSNNFLPPLDTISRPPF